MHSFISASWNFRIGILQKVEQKFRLLTGSSFVCLLLQGEAGTGNVVEAVRHCRAVVGAIKQLKTLDEDELYVYAKELRAPLELVQKVKELGRYATFSFCQTQSTIILLHKTFKALNSAHLPHCISTMEYLHK